MAKDFDGGVGRFRDRADKEKRHQAQLPGDEDAPLPDPVAPIKGDKSAPGRNDPCTCGSGKKFKKCCGAA